MTLRILLIDAQADRAQALAKKLSQSGFATILRAQDGADLAATVRQTMPDLIIVDMALPDRDALEDIRVVSGQHPIVMFAGSDDPAFAEEAIAAGVCSYNLSGVASRDLRPILASAVALFRRYRHIEDELAAAKAKLEERRLIEHAKAILMQGRKMTEPEAYRWLQKRAMDENRKLAQVVAEMVERHQIGDEAEQTKRKQT
ncbi:MAG: ANTAR domain-containing protein [Methylocella sp.]